MAIKIVSRDDGLYEIHDTARGYVSSPMSHAEALGKIDLQIEFGPTLRKIAESIDQSIDTLGRLEALYARPAAEVAS